MADRGIDVLLVSEDVEFLVGARQKLAAAGVTARACLGPAQSPCLLDRAGSCSLARHATVAIVDSPVSGSFERHTRSVRSGTYAERLAQAHPDIFVLLAGASFGCAGGEVAHAATREQAVDLVLMTSAGSSEDRQFGLK